MIATLSMLAAFGPGSQAHSAGFCYRISKSFGSRDARLLTCLNVMKDTGEMASPRRKWICAAGRILFLLPESSFWNGLCRVNYFCRSRQLFLPLSPRLN